MAQVFEIRLSGTGGQGIILAGIILAEAAIIDNMNAVQSQSYGPEARGGASKAEVIISDEEIYYPKVSNPHLFLALSQEAYNKYIDSVRENAWVIVDSSVDAKDRDDIRLLSIPILSTAEEKMQKSMVANIIALGAIAEYTGIVSIEALGKAVLARVPKGTEELNMNALDEGINLVRNRMKG